MKPSNQQVNGHQPKKGNKREDKKSTNIRWNSGIFFQIGLIVALVVSVFAMDLKVGEKPAVVNIDDGPDFFEMPVVKYILDEPKPQPPQQKPIARVTPPAVQPKLITDIIDVIKNDDNFIDTKVAVTPPVVKGPPVKEIKKAPPVVVDKGPKNINTVEFVPVFPGCESAGNNTDRIACMNSKISRFVSRKFRTDVADDKNQALLRIAVRFTIDKNGNVVNVTARSTDRALQKEAQRVVNMLPPMSPGKQGDNSVDVEYVLPISFRMH